LTHLHSINYICAISNFENKLVHVNTLTIAPPINTEILSGVDLNVQPDEKVSVEAPKEVAANSTAMSFRAIVLQRNWVKDVITYINEQDLSKLLEADAYQMIHIKQKITENGVYRFKKRIGFLQYLVYEIQNWWDYD
jgi:hypothetical protein